MYAERKTFSSDSLSGAEVVALAGTRIAELETALRQVEVRLRRVIVSGGAASQEELEALVEIAGQAA